MRKNWLFSDTPGGANAGALTFSMVETEKACGVDIYQYLKFLLTKMPNKGYERWELEKLSPWSSECKEALAEMHQQQIKAILDAI